MSLPEDSNLASFLAQFPTRSELIKDIGRQPNFDLVIAGGGIHGACFARVAAFNGLKTLLLERSDYASATSSRSSKMAHGGLRYLELFDFSQVLEGIRAREELFTMAAHLVRPQPFLVPVPKSESFFKLKLGLGLWFYDLLVRENSRRHRWLAGEELNQLSLPWQNERYSGAYQYFDGSLDDARLVIENIIAARQEGALCLNYASLVSTAKTSDAPVAVGWRDELTGKLFSIQAGIVVNCSGPWVSTLGRLSPGPLAKRIAYSQGTHLIFNVPWSGPALLLPLGGRGKYYFVWPYQGRTLVGTTEREVTELATDPQPSRDEIQELLSRLKHDLPDSGLKAENLYYCFAGVRTLPLRRGKSDLSKISRRHFWDYSGGVLSLVGGKFTTAHLTAYDGLKKVFSLAGISRPAASIKGRALPGSAFLGNSIATFRKAAESRGVNSALIQATVNRLGSRVRFFEEAPEYYDVLGGTVLRGEVEQAFDVEQVEFVEDILRRRLTLEQAPDHGLNLLPELKSIFALKRPGKDFESQEKVYRERLEKIKLLCRG